LIKATQPTVPVPDDFNFSSYSVRRCGISVENDSKPFFRAKFVAPLPPKRDRRTALIFVQLELDFLLLQY
jgi:hypothetical protein